MSIQLRDKSGLLNKVAGVPEVDAILSPTSTNPVQNKSIYAALAQKVEKSVTDLVNYYDKTQTYNKAEVRQLIGAINTVTIEVVATLPVSEISSTTIYFVGPATGTNTYEEYVYVNNTWVKIGDTDIDLTQYVTSANLTTILQSYYTKSAMDSLLDSYYTKSEADAQFQATLTFDSAPTTGSTNPVTSSGIKTALDAKQDALTFDITPTANSSNPVTSAGIKAAVDDRVSWSNNTTLGAHNILPFPYVDGSSKVDNGVTFTVNADGTVLAKGTPTGGNANFTLANLANVKTFLVDGDHYILSGCPEGGGYDKYRLEYSNWVDRGYEDYGEGVTLTKFSDSYSNQKVNIRIEEGQVLPTDGLLYKPMIRLAADTDTTYAPYVMTNQQLTNVSRTWKCPRNLYSIDHSFDFTTQKVQLITGDMIAAFGPCSSQIFGTIFLDNGIQYVGQFLYMCDANLKGHISILVHSYSAGMIYHLVNRYNTDYLAEKISYTLQS